MMLMDTSPQNTSRRVTSDSQFIHENRAQQNTSNRRSSTRQSTTADRPSAASTGTGAFSISRNGSVPSNEAPTFHPVSTGTPTTARAAERS